MIRFLLLSVYLVQEVLDELLLVLGRGLDGRSSLLLLTTTASGEVDTTEQGAHDAHGEGSNRESRQRWKLTARLGLYLIWLEAGVEVP